MQSLSDWNRKVWQAWQGLPASSYFSGIHPNLSGITGIQGDILVNATSHNTGSVVWIMTSTGPNSSRTGWQAVMTQPLP